MTFTDLKAASGDATLPASIWEYKQQGYVQVNSSWMYTCNYDVLTDSSNWTNHPCHSGWYPDALFDVPAGGIPLIPKGKTQPIFIEACVPYGTAAGNYSGEFQLAGNGISYGISVDVEVWSIDIPKTNASDAFGTAFSWGSTGQWELEKWYGPQSRQLQNMTNAEIWRAWMPFLSKHRIPGDDWYNQAPRPTEEMLYRVETGSRQMNLMNSAFWSGSGIGPNGYNETVSKEMTAKILALLEPTIANLTAEGHFDKLVAYGFDEFCGRPKAGGCPGNQTIYDLYGALQNRWPGLKTMATLQWDSLPADLPVTIWVDEVSDYYDGEADPSKWPASYKIPSEKEKARLAWLATGKEKEYWWYWCLDPEDDHYMNTFVERRVIDSRLLFWLAALHGIQGMLYYSVNNQWSQSCGECATVAYHGVDPTPACKIGCGAGCPTLRDCQTADMLRINNTARTLFSPVGFHGPNNAPLAGGTNGGGQIVYPGIRGPIASNRLVNIADGIEDLQLFKMLGTGVSPAGAIISHADDLIVQLVSNMSRGQPVSGVQVLPDPVRLEQVRREAARRVMAQQRGEADANFRS